MRLIRVRFLVRVGTMAGEFLDELGITVYSISYVYEDTTERACNMIIDDGNLAEIEC